MKRFLNCNTRKFAGPDYLSGSKVNKSDYVTIDDSLITSIIDALVEAHTERDAAALGGMIRGIYPRLFKVRPQNW